MRVSVRYATGVPYCGAANWGTSQRAGPPGYDGAHTPGAATATGAYTASVRRSLAQPETQRAASAARTIFMFKPPEKPERLPDSSFYCYRLLRPLRFQFD